MSKKRRKKKNSFKQIIGRIFSCLLIVSYILFTSMVTIMDILPLSLFLPVFIGLFICVILLCLLLLFKKIKIGLKIVGILLSIIFTSIFIIGALYIYQTYDFMGKIGAKHIISEDYYIVVNKESYSSFNQLKNKEIGTYNEKIEIYDKATQELEKTGKYNMKEFDSVQTMAEELINEGIDAILISSTHKAELDENYEGFSELTEVLHTITAKIRAVKADKHKKVDMSAKTFTIYISGNDSSGTISDRGRSDVNMLATVNPKTHEILLNSIPRDYYVRLHDTTGYKDKLTHAGIYGVDMSVKTIEDLMDINIDYYIKVNFSTLINLVDTIGGIDVYSDISFRPWANQSLYIKEGMNHMDGKMAIAFARERYSYETGDRHRVQNQQDVLTAIINKLTSTPSILLKYTKILNSLSSSFETDIEIDNFKGLVKIQLKKNPDWTIKTYNVNGFDAHEYTYSFGSQELYVMEPDYETVTKAHDYIQGMIEGKTLEELGFNEEKDS